MSANNSLEGPYRPVIVNLPVALIETLDDVANEHDMDRSELIRITLKLHQDRRIVVEEEREPSNWPSMLNPRSWLNWA